MVRRPSFELAFEFLKRAMFRQQNTSMAIGKQFHSVALKPENMATTEVYFVQLS
uniref:Uncharacterized protein n=3 Tax=Candidatus Kentrum eta TaxID=2126337 RepID=A0A450VAL8_9GAMM|nr:MAG: hypothetical protein BECKH772B_GA0070898_102484 [Candidatus Kentron sp. H]